ncbi:MAG: heme o synthase [Planctomycetota bacterium]
MDNIATNSITLKRRLSYFLELTKPRILVMILLTVVMAMIAVGSSVSWVTVLHACVGTAMVAASASVLNQWLERDRDAVMFRTSKRPLPSGRVAVSQAAWMGWVLLLVGSLYLTWFVNIPTMLCGFATWLLYVWVYTPLKTVSWTNTLVGTIPGALPVWMGWAAAGGSLWDFRAWVLLGVLIAWQLPHFMSIAFMYAEQYESAGYKMITVTDRSGWGAGLHAILGSVALVALAPLAVPATGWFSGVLMLLAVAVSLWQLWASIRFVRNQERQTARRMLHVSLLHLPLTMLLILICSWN